jgi:hypothetical protein
MSTIYTGPGKLYMSTTALWPEGENGEMKMEIVQDSEDVGTAMDGRVASVQTGAMVKVSLTPFDNWGALSLLYPTIVKTPAPGTRAHTASDVPASLWTPDGRLYVIPRAAVTKHPDLHLGVGKALFGPTEITGLIATGKSMGDSGAFYTITETAGADPGGQMTMSDFIREKWTGFWGTNAGFLVGAQVEAEDEWTISFDVKYQSFAVQKLVRVMTLTSVSIMAKCRPFGPTQSNIDTAIGLNAGRILGSRFGTGTADLVLTSTSGKTITLKSADVKGAGFEFGGSKLGNGEIAFVNQMTFTAGVRQPLIVFSA